MAERLHLELLIGRRVHDSTGATRIGRIEEVTARIDGKECLIEEFLVGRYALGERIAAAHIGRALLDLFGARAHGGGYRVRWDQIDLSNPHHIRLKVPPAELRPIAD
jgi:sporulation protein YlmC with PRC-barrel domain